MVIGKPVLQCSLSQFLPQLTIGIIHLCEPNTVSSNQAFQFSLWDETGASERSPGLSVERWLVLFSYLHIHIFSGVWRLIS